MKCIREYYILYLVKEININTRVGNDMKKAVRILGVSILASSLLVTPVMAAPDIDTLQKNKKEAQNEVDSLQSELTSLMKKINKLEEDLVEKGKEVQKVTDDLKKAEEKEKQQYEDMKLRIKYMYEQGQSSFESVLTSGSTSDALNQATYVKEIHDYDRKKLEEYVETKEKVENLKEKLETEMDNLESMQKNFETDKSELNATISEKKEEVADFETKIEAAREEAAREQAEKERATTNQSGTTTVKNNSGGSSGSSDYTAPSNKGGGAGIVAAARGYLGVPYVWGGESSSGLDCSGLVMLAHQAVGISLSHSSGSQGAGGKSVPNMASALPGDVVCYSGHVGIYIGGGQMIHAPKPGDHVKVASVYGSPWFRRYW